MSLLRSFVRCAIVLLWSVAACTEGGVAPSGGGSAVTTQVVITPGQVRLAAVGDTARLHASLYDSDGNLLGGTTVTWASADPAVFTIDQNGLVTGRQAQSVGRAIASASGHADTAYVVVANPGAAPCLGYASPVTLAVGQAVSVSMSDGACITSAGGGDEYVVMPWFGTSDSLTIPLEVTGIGLAAPPVNPMRAPLASRSLSATDWHGGARPSLRRDLAFERGIRELGRREIMPLASRARAELLRRALSPDLSTAPAYLRVGDLVQLNANIVGCVSPIFRTGRVAATSARAIVVADTNNPSGGFTDADYARFAIGYDTLVAAVEDAAFGTPTDIDANGKVVIFFTRAVNELTPAGGASAFVGGFFHPRDLLPQTYYGQPYCPSSNEREMIYMPVPDPTGTVNGNALSAGLIDSLTIATLAHENQHLVNFGRRVYVNNALGDEEPWLNEGLSDIAEELVFYHAAGLSPRQNIGGASFGTQSFNGLFTMYMAPNFARLAVFLQQPQSYSPFSSNDQSGTYGAIWAFLRYAADHHASSDGDVWLRLANSPVSGFANLYDVFGADLAQLLDAWALSVYTDDRAPSVDSAYTQPSWNFRSAFPALPTGAQPYPLAVGGLSDGTAQPVSLRDGSSAYFGFSIAAGTDAVIRLTSNGWMPPATVQATIVRTK